MQLIKMITLENNLVVNILNEIHKYVNNDELVTVELIQNSMIEIVQE